MTRYNETICFEWRDPYVSLMQRWSDRFAHLGIVCYTNMIIPTDRKHLEVANKLVHMNVCKAKVSAVHAISTTAYN